MIASGTQNKQCLRRSLGFWIISPWRHIMVSLWGVPIFLFIYGAHREDGYHGPDKGQLGLVWLALLFSVVADVIAARKAPDIRLKREDMVLLQEQGGPFCCLTWRDMQTRLGIVAVALGLILYTVYRRDADVIDSFTAQYCAGAIIGITLAIISIMGVRVRSIAHLPADDAAFVVSPRLRKTIYYISGGPVYFPKGENQNGFDGVLTGLKHVLLIMFGWPGFFYVFTFFCAWAGLVTLSGGWSGTLTLHMLVSLTVYCLFLMCVSLTPSAYAISKMKPYSNKIELKR